MFCSNCGKELKEGEIYCSNCGTKVGESGKSVKTGCDLKEQLQGVGSIGNSFERLGDNKLSYFAAILLQLVSIFLVGKEMFSIGYEIFYTTHTSHFTLFEEHEGWETLFIIGYIVAAAAMLIPLLLNKEWKLSYFIVGICMPLVSMAWLAVFLINAKKQIVSSEYSDFMDALGVSTKLTGNAWIFILISAAAAMLTYLAYKNLMLAQEQNKKRAAQTVGYGQAGTSGKNTVVCPKCGAVQKRGSAFCGSCYAPLIKIESVDESWICPDCHTENSANYSVCQKCGKYHSSN